MNDLVDMVLKQMPFKTKEEKRLYDQTRYRANSEDKKAYVKAYKKAHPEWTKASRKAHWKGYYQKNGERLRDRAKTYARDNAEQRKAQRKAYIRANAEQIKARRKAYREANAERIKAYRESRKAQDKVYREANRERRRLNEKTYLESSPARKLLAQYRKMIHLKLSRQNTRKSGKTIVLLGCDIHWLIAWLEVQLQPGMTWQNYGPVWHVDHKRPCASFNLNDPAQQRLCFHWTNLQPLFAEENLSKGSKWEISQEAA